MLEEFNHMEIGPSVICQTVYGNSTIKKRSGKFRLSFRFIYKPV
jgi:hypothetical protein